MIVVDLIGTGVDWEARQWLHYVVKQENWWWDNSYGYLDFNRIVFKHDEDATMFKLAFGL